MSAPTSPSPLTVPVCRLPGSVSLAMVFNLLLTLPRPPVGGPVHYGRTMIRDAMAMLWDAQPRDVLEAMQVVQMIMLIHSARHATIMAAAHEGNLGEMIRWGKNALALQRTAAALERHLYQRRQATAPRGGVEAPPGWTYELAALEAAWRKGPVLVWLETEEEAAAADAPLEWPENEVMEAAAAPSRQPSRQERRVLARMQHRLASREAAEARLAAGVG